VAPPASILAAGYVPFMQPLPVWDYWYLLAVPLCAAVSIVYKSIRCRSMRKVPREAAKATGWILAGLVLAAVVLATIVKVMEQAV
jgi:hypothetical protein